MKRNKDQTDPSADQQKMNPADRAITQKIRKSDPLRTRVSPLTRTTSRSSQDGKVTLPRASTVRRREEQFASKSGGSSRPGQRHQSAGSGATEITETELGV
jgi:hypothetical protein